MNNHVSTYKIITSDLNFGNCFCKYPILTHKPLDAFAPDIFTSHGFTQIIDIPTRITDNTISLIDLFFADNVDDIVCHGTLPKIADHDGVLASYQLNIEKPKAKTKTIYDYKNADIQGLIDHVKQLNFDTAVFSYPTEVQADKYSELLINAFNLFVPSKTITIRPNDQPWSNTYTRLLLRKKNRNYQIYKKINADFNHLTSQINTPPEVLTRYLNKQKNASSKAKASAHASDMANRRVKSAFYNTVNSTMNNHSISAKKKFSILLRLMKNNKLSGISPLKENDEIINDSKKKSEIFNNYFASKSHLNGKNDDPPKIEKIENIPH